MGLMHGKYISTTEARRRLPELVDRVQDPRDWVILTRHGRKVAALVSFEDLKRIFDVWDTEDADRRPPLPDGLVRIPGGGVGTPRQAADVVLKRQMDRKREREVLAAGGLSPLAGGEVTVVETVPPGGAHEARSGDRAGRGPRGEPQTEAEWEAWLRGGEIRSDAVGETSGGGFKDRTGGAPGGDAERTDRPRRWWRFW